MAAILLFAAIAPGQTVTGKHVRVAVSARPQTVHPGDRVTLAMDLSLNPGLHVYAPGVEDFIPIAWSMKPNPAAAVQPVTFPPSRKVHLPIIDETVPVYEGHIHLARNAILSKSAMGNITLEGVLRYQACDDRMCYIPENLAVKWTVQVQSR